MNESKSLKKFSTVTIERKKLSETCALHQPVNENFRSVWNGEMNEWTHWKAFVLSHKW
jgi:hypothetical protein